MLKLTVMQNTKIIILVIFSCLITRSNGQCAKFIANINFLGQGYNVFKGNPHATLGTDPGFTNFNLIDFKYPDNPADSKPADSSYFNPIGVSGTKVANSRQKMHLNQIKTIKEYIDFLYQNINVKDQLEFTPFCASDDFQRIKTGLSKDYVFFEHYNSLQEQKLLLIHDDALDVVSLEFIEKMKELLDAGEDESAYHNIFNLIGTHVSEEVILGSRFGYIFQLDKEYATSNMYGISNEITQLILRLGDSFENSETMYLNLHDLYKNWRSLSVGKLLLYNLKKQVNYQFDNYMPIETKLISLQEFILKYKKNIQSSDIIIDRLNKYFKTYCQYLLTSSNKDPSSCNK